MLQRNVQGQIKADLNKKMVILSGPRQCGKTTLAKLLIPEGMSYYNWDIANDRKLLNSVNLNLDKKLWILDEVHKKTKWRNWLKGIYDQFHDSHSILVTGSARLELYGKGGDSLQGRYFQHHLHPLTFSEVAGTKDFDWKRIEQLPNLQKKFHTEILSNLLLYGGFPEPFTSNSQKLASRWRLNYSERIIQDEVRSLENIQQLDKMETLFDTLPTRVGSVLSINSLREDLETSFHTVKNWIQIFERLYGVFRVYPYGSEKLKAVKKESKLYLWDWARVENEGARFENLVALHLLRLAHWMEDIEGKKCELRYFRSTLAQEVDFILLLQGKPWFTVEVKLKDEELDRSTRYFLERTNVPFAFQVSLEGKKNVNLGKIGHSQVRIIPASLLLANLP